MKRKLSLKNPLKAIPTRKREPYDPLKHGVSVSALGLQMNCREAARLRYVIGLRPLLERLPFAQGSTYHEAMEVTIGDIRDNAAVGVDEALLKNHMDEYVKKYIQKNPGSTAACDAVREAATVAQILVPEHFDYYEEDFNKDWTDVEGKFRVEIKIDSTTTIPFIGKIDASYKKKGDLRLMEHKFLSQISDGKIDSLPLDLQVGGYIYASDAVGVDYNIIRKPGLRRKQGESYSEFCDRIVADIAKRPKWYFERHSVNFTKHDRKYAKKRLRNLIREFYYWWEDASAELEKRDILFNSGACESKYGMCEYLNVCVDGDCSGFRPLAK